MPGLNREHSGNYLTLAPQYGALANLGLMYGNGDGGLVT